MSLIIFCKFLKAILLSKINSNIFIGLDSKNKSRGNLNKELLVLGRE